MQIDETISERHLTKHPFYERWQRGEVSKSTLREYAKQYYSYESALPRFLSSALSHVEEGPARQALEENLSDESGNPKPHSEMWLQFADALGLPKEEVQSATPSSATANLIDTYQKLSEKDSSSAIGALYAYESQFAVVAKTKADGLRAFYGITDPVALEFFDWHSANDDEHAATLRAALDDDPATEGAVESALDAWWGMLDQFV